MKLKFAFLILCFSLTFSHAQVELSDTDAESKLLVNNDRLIVLDFYATWCGPCKLMDPIIKELAQKYGDKVDFYKIDVDKSSVDDALNVTAMPTYLFIKNSKSLEQKVGAMSKTEMEQLIISHMSSNTTSSTYNADDKHGDSDEFSDLTIDDIWNSSSKLNSLAWHAYLKHNDIDVLLKAIKIVERSIELEKTYYNVDTHAALLYKTGNYTKALKKAKEAIEIAKSDGEDYSTTSELINKIIDKM